MWDTNGLIWKGLRMMRRSLCFALLMLLAGCSMAVAPTMGGDPFEPTITYADGRVTVDFAMSEPDQHIYDDMLQCSLGLPLAKPAESSLDADGRVIYEGFASFSWPISPGQTFTLDYQGCDEEQCYMPQSRTYSVTSSGDVVEGALLETPSVTPEPAPLPEELQPEPSAPSATPAWTMRKQAGFVPPEAFVEFLQNQSLPEVNFFDDPHAWVARNGFWWLLAVVFLGGLALNLTPCVLPMMPINLAIIGAGAAGGSRLRGALRGGAYGLGIALAYGVLALIPVLTGTAFGTIQSAWWFNALIAVIFLLLALALFDLFMIDFTRFTGPGSGKQGAFAAFIAGAVSAVLAGACVAPVLIAVLLLTADYVAAGTYWALLLPFVLGLGMAAPWPIAGAGLSFLPKPGAWMVWVKKLFGLVVLLFAVYYGWTAWKVWRNAHLAERFAEISANTVQVDGADLPALEAAIAKARAEGRPVLLDFWGTACKACDEMDAETFPADSVQQELTRFTLIKVRMDLADKRIKPTQERFGILGLPTYIVIDE